MASTLVVQSIDSAESENVLHLIHSAVDAEIRRLELASALSLQRLAAFESIYNVPSATFAATFTAEDLHGGDNEYVEWAGEYKHFQHLQKHLEYLRNA